MKAIEQRRAICFVPSLHKKRHQFHVDGSAGNSLESSRVEEGIGTTPVNFQRVMNDGARRPRTGSPCPERRVPTTSSTEGEDGPTLKTEGVECELNDSIGEIHLNEEHLASIQPTLGEGSLDDHVGNWLSRTVTPPVEETSLYFQRTNAEVGFWYDTETGSPSDTAFGRALLSRALIDATNLCRPGYLQYNSFAKQNLVRANNDQESGTVDEQEEAISPSSEASTIQLSHSVHEQSRGGARHFVQTSCPSSLAALKIVSVPPFEASTPLPLVLLRESALDRVIQQAQFELTRMRLEGYVVTDTSSESEISSALPTVSVV